MRINTKCDFKFNVSVSTTHYEGKCNEWGKLRYQTKEVTIDELGDYITEGYCFTHTFKEVSADGTFGCKEKTIKNFKSSNTLFIDVDDSNVTAEDFFSTITPQPTILYTTPSNLTGEKNRYRLVYIFEDLIFSNDVYRCLVNSISNCIKQFYPDFVFDCTSINVSQQMGGNGSGSCLMYKSYNLFNLNDFQEWYCSSTNYKKEERNDIINRNAVGYEEKDIEITDKEFERRFWEINVEDSADALLRDYKDIYYISDTTQVDEDIAYISLSNYTEISRRYYMDKHEELGYYIPRPVKIKEGNRERILFSNALLRLRINPDMSFENLLYAMVYERQVWIDNKDGEMTNKVLYKVAKGAYTKRERYSISGHTIGQQRKWAKTNKCGYKVNKAFCNKYDIPVRTMANLMRGDISNNTLLENYDFDKCVAENSRLLKEKGITPNSERRLYIFKQWCRSNNINIR